MKTILALILIIVSMSSFAATKDCKEMDGAFPGTIRLVMQDERFVGNVLHAETDKSGFKQVEEFEPNPQNKYFRGGSEYFVTIKTSKKTYEGKLSLTTGGELQFFPGSEAFYFSCDY